MGSQAIETAAPKHGNPFFLVDEDVIDMTGVHWAVVQGVSFQRDGASIAFSPKRSQPREGSGGRSRVVARASVSVAACILYIYIGAVADTAACGESTAIARELASVRAELDAARIVDPKVAQAIAAEIEQKQALKQELKRERDRVDALARELTSVRAELEAARTVDPEVTQAGAAEVKQQQALKQELKREQDRADALARELASVRAELEAA